MNPEKVIKGEYKDYKAIFHHWSERFWTIGESLMRGGCAGGQMSQTVAIVEYEDGTVHECFRKKSGSWIAR